MSDHINTATWPVTVSCGGTVEPGGIVALPRDLDVHDQALVDAGHLAPLSKPPRQPAAARGKE